MATADITRHFLHPQLERAITRVIAAFATRRRDEILAWENDGGFKSAGDLTQLLEELERTWTGAILSTNGRTDAFEECLRQATDISDRAQQWPGNVEGSPAWRRDEAAASLESIIETVEMLTDQDDARRIRQVLRLVETELRKLDDLIVNMVLPSDAPKGGAA